MKNSMTQSSITFKSLFLSLTLFVFFLSACSSDDDSGKDKASNNYIAETQKNLVGEWRLVSSTLNGELVGEAQFKCLKQSRANFNNDKTYSISFKKLGSGSTDKICSQTTMQSGTYSIDALNSIEFFNSTSEIKLIDNTLQITTVVTNGKSSTDIQVDTFIRSDSEELDNNDDVAVGDDDTDGTTNNSSTFDGTAVIAKLLGTWEIDNVVNDCVKKNTLEFKSETKFDFKQHQTRFNRNDLLKYNVNVVVTNINGVQSISVKSTITTGYETVVFDSDAECQLVKTSEFGYIVKDDTTVVLKNSNQVEMKLVSDTELKLRYTYLDSESKEQVLEFDYKKKED